MTTRLRLLYVQAFHDKKTRRTFIYFRRDGSPRVRLPGLPGSPEFMAAYQAALAACSSSVPTAADDDAKARSLVGGVGASRTKPGTFDDVVTRYYVSPKFTRLEKSTQTTYRGIIERMRPEMGSLPVALLNRKNVERMVQARAATPSAANNFLRLLRMLMEFAVKMDLRDDNPTHAVDKVAVPKGGIPDWEEDRIAIYEAKYPIGTQARLAMALMLYTGCRRGDVVRLGRHNVKDGVLTYTQEKNGRRNPITPTIPVHPELVAIIAATPNEHLLFITTEYGRPFAKAGFGNKMRAWCDAAGLPECSSHGLRKSIARRLAEAGCTAHQIMSITGHLTLKEVQRYIEAANKKAGARVAMAKLQQPPLAVER